MGKSSIIVCAAERRNIRHRRDVLAALMLTASSVGCGATPRQTTAVQPATASRAEDDVVCRTETPVGSHLPQTRCYQRKDQEQAREATRRALDRP